MLRENFIVKDRAMLALSFYSVTKRQRPSFSVKLNVGPSVEIRRARRLSYKKAKYQVLQYSTAKSAIVGIFFAKYSHYRVV